jgi:hypothetical protein
MATSPLCKKRIFFLRKNFNPMKTNTHLRVCFLALTFLIFLSTSGFSQTLKQSRDLQSFSGVEVSGVFTIYLSESDQYSLVIEAREDVLADIETSYSRNKLRIRYKGEIGNPGEMKAYISMPEITMISGSGATNWKSVNTLSTDELTVIGSGAASFFLDLNVNKLTCRLSGATNSTFSGRAANHKLNVSGASIVNAFDLNTRDTYATVSGASTARINARNSIKADVSGTSNVIYQGRPKSHDFHTTGLSSVRTVNNETVYKTDYRINSKAGNHNSRPKKRHRREFRGNWDGVELGVNGLLTADGGLEMPEGFEFMDLQYERSIALHLNMYQQDFAIISNNLGLVTGLGLSWNNYRFGRDVIPVRLPEGIDVISPNPEFVYRRSKMNVWYLNVPMLLEFQTGASHGKQFHLSGGVITGLRLHSSTRQVYFINGTRNRDKTIDDFHMRPFRFDATARIGWGDVSLFANYSLNSLFRHERGPEVYPFSVGIRIF